MEIYQGKRTCKTLKSIRRKIADANEIVYEPKECTHEGDCAGTCPACEAEVKYLERQLSLRRRAGKAVAIVGLSLGLAAMSSCGTTKTVGKAMPAPDTGLVPNPDTTQTEPLLMGLPPAPPELVDGPGNMKLEGDVPYTPPQSENSPEVDNGSKVNSSTPTTSTSGKKKSTSGKKKSKKKKK